MQQPPARIAALKRGRQAQLSMKCRARASMRRENGAAAAPAQTVAKARREAQRGIPPPRLGARGARLFDGHLEGLGQVLFHGLHLASGAARASAGATQWHSCDKTGPADRPGPGACLHDGDVLLQRVQLPRPHPREVARLALRRSGRLSRQTLACTGPARRRAGGAAARPAAARAAARAPQQGAWRANRRAQGRTLAQEGPKNITHSESRCAAAATFSGTSARLVGSATRPCAALYVNTPLHTAKAARKPPGARPKRPHAKRQQRPQRLTHRPKGVGGARARPHQVADLKLRERHMRQVEAGRHGRGAAAAAAAKEASRAPLNLSPAPSPRAARACGRERANAAGGSAAVAR